jgi:hypothetical protein
MATKQSFTSEELYRIALENGAQSTARELAHRYGMKEPNFVAAIAKYAAENKKPLPKLAFEKSQTTVKPIRRARKDKDIRVSNLRLQNAGLGNALAFKIIADPENDPPRLIIVEDFSAPKALRVTLAKAEKPTKVTRFIDDSHLFETSEEEKSTPVVRKRGRPKKIMAAV